MSFFLYIRDLFKVWYGYVSGGIPVVTVLISNQFDVLKGLPIEWWYGFIVFPFVSGFGVWLKQEKEKSDLQIKLSESERRLNEKPLTEVQKIDRLNELWIKGSEIEDLWIKGDVAQRDAFVKWRSELEEIGVMNLEYKQMEKLRYAELHFDDYSGLLSDMVNCGEIFITKQAKDDFFYLHAVLRELSVIVKGRPTKLIYR